MKLKNLLLLFSFLLFKTSFCQIGISAGNTISESFNLGVLATAPLPASWKIDKLSTVRTVGTYSAAGTSTEQRAGNNMSSSASNGRYNFGAGISDMATDRAIGGVSSGSGSASVNAYTFLNNTGSNTIGSFAISYNVEKYRQGTNIAGFRMQLFYSTDGNTWTDAGGDFLTTFAADPATAGYTPAPGVTVAVSNTLNVSLPISGNLYLAWNYSVSSGTTASNAQALGIDDVSITANADCEGQTLSASTTDLTCNGISNGAIDLTASGGSLPVVSYSWTGPNGFTASTEDLSSLAAGMYTVVVTATGGCTATDTYTINEPAVLTATATLDAPIECIGGSSSISVVGNGGVAPYNGIGTFAISQGSYSYTVTDQNGCSASTGNVVVADGTGVAPLQPSSPSFSPSQRNLCAETSITLTVPNDPTATSYNWVLPVGFTGSSTTNSIVVTPDGNSFGKVTFPVTASNGCGTSTSRNVNIYGQPSKPIISGPTCVSIVPSIGLSYSISNPEVGVNYTWSASNNVIIQSGQGTSSVLVDWNRTTEGFIHVNADNACDSSPNSRLKITICPIVNSIIASDKRANIYPNPSYGDTYLILNSFIQSKCTIVISDLGGRSLLRNEISTSIGKNKIVLNTANLSRGMYIVSITNGTTTEQLKLIKE